MKKLKYVFAFILLTAIFCGIWLALNAAAPVLDHSSMLPDDLHTRQYRLSGVRWDSSRGGYHLSFIGNTKEDLLLTISDSDEATVYLWDESLHSWTEEDQYQRVQSIRLPREIINEKGGVDLLFRSESWGSETRELLNQQTITPAKLMLGGEQITNYALTLTFGISMLSIGMHILLIAGSLILYSGKPTEHYLLMLALVGSSSLISSLLSLSPSVLPIINKTYYQIQPAIAVFPVVMYAAIIPLLFFEQTPGWLQKILTVKKLLIFTVVLTAIRLLSSYSFYMILRALLLIPTIWILSKACTHRAFGAKFMLINHAISSSVVVFMYLINNMRLTEAGMLISYLRMNQLSYLFVLIAAMFISHKRFAQKFCEAENLTLALAQMNAHLDALVEQKTNQLWEEQRRKNAMLANVFHDLRSPIFIIQGNLEQIHPAKEEMHFITAIQTKLSFLKRLTEDLFLISKMDDGVVLYEENPMDLSQCLFALEAANRTEAQTRNVSLCFECGSGMTLWADEQRIQQALQNLIDNAFQYTPDGGRICIQTVCEGSQAVIHIRDNGAGIPERDLPLVFERYFKNTQANRARSSGLGLYICRSIIEHHHGTISVSSKEGAGSCFTIRLPLLPQDKA